MLRVRLHRRGAIVTGPDGRLFIRCTRECCTLLAKRLGELADGYGSVAGLRNRLVSSGYVVPLSGDEYLVNHGVAYDCFLDRRVREERFLVGGYTARRIYSATLRVCRDLGGCPVYEEELGATLEKIVVDGEHGLFIYRPGENVSEYRFDLDTAETIEPGTVLRDLSEALSRARSMGYGGVDAANVIRIYAAGKYACLGSCSCAPPFKKPGEEALEEARRIAMLLAAPPPRPTGLHPATWIDPFLRRRFDNVGGPHREIVSRILELLMCRPISYRDTGCGLRGFSAECTLAPIGPGDCAAGFTCPGAGGVYDARTGLLYVYWSSAGTVEEAARLYEFIRGRIMRPSGL